MRYSKLGGQAVIEGVMMKHEKEYSVAVRKPDGGIEVTKKATSSIRDKYKIASLPIIRGMVIFAESLSTGMKTLNYSASFFEEEEKEAKEKNEKKESLVMGLVMLLAIVHGGWNLCDCSISYFRSIETPGAFASIAWID